MYNKDTKKMEHLKKSIFENLLKNAECQTGQDTEVIGFVSEYRNNSMSFYSDEDDTIVEDYGRVFRGKWMQLEPTKEQKEQMTKLIDEKYLELTEPTINDAFTDADYTHFESLIYN